ncbi:L,D-transpeptidase family protein [Methylomonas montana]|uniref:L,D-transpeptidase family protein n=1 Tax=Methylomonas montana TaxID=3058963 RepID=UPI002658B2FE|nr:L,D-transpeptidase family protein [Methylomonas montana]WKJ90455.1 L,D-transpeptidase family protein [Methylomonas montana]
MLTKPHTLKDSSHRYAWFALVACVAYADTERAFSAELPAPALETSAPLIDSFPGPANFIPADQPIGAILLSKQHPLLLRADFSRVSDFVSQIYQNANFQPIWFTANRSEKNLHDLIGMLNNAPSDALNQVNYDVDRLKTFIDGQSLDNNTAASYDVALTVSLVRYLHDLRQGQVEPRDVQYPVHIAPKPPLDLAGLLKQHLASQTLPELVGLFEPKAKQYRQLKQILTRLRELGNQTGPDDFNPGKRLRPGDKHPQIAYLRQRLRAMGLIEDKANADAKTYDGDLVAAVKKVQQQQGLKADGVIGPATAALFNPSSDEKIAQLELAMERARWIPDPIDGPMIVVNIPAFELWAFNSVDDTNPLNMKVIVGKAPDKQTPVLWEEMKYLEFMPYWNIPTTIFKKEILPKAANNEGYLASQNIELVKHQNSEEQGGGSYLRARQRPGKKNPLGRVKFVFPNTADVYLHDTPGHAAFNRQRRDLSHGCVRVSQPEQLAQFVLGDQQGWDKETIKQAMSAPKTRHVTLKRAVPVLFYYATTFVDHGNQLRFYPDIYGQDEQLKKALNKLHVSTVVSSAADNQLVASKSTPMTANP